MDDLAASHGLGTLVFNAATAADAMKQAGLDWQVVKRPAMVMFPDGSVSNIEELNAVVKLPEKRILGVVGNVYRISQNAETFSFFDPVSKFKMGSYHSAGSLYEGRLVWMIVRLIEPMFIGGTRIEKNLLMTNSHDGKRTISVSCLPMRTEDGNLLNFVIPGTMPASIYHKRSPREEDGIESLRCALEFYKLFAEYGNQLCKREFSLPEFRCFLDKVFPKKKLSDLRMNKAKEIITEMFFEEQRQTAWGALNAVCHYADEFKIVRNENEEKRLESVWMGGAADFKQICFDVLWEMVPYAS